MRLAFIISLITLSIVIILLLGRTVNSDLRSLSVAQSDDISWNVSQLEVELLQMQNAALEAGQVTESDLKALRTRFDIFYSRVSSLSQSASFRSLRDDETARRLFSEANDFLESVTPIVDSSDDVLRAALPEIQTQINALRPNMRKLALVGLESFATEETARRGKLSNTLVHLAVASLTLMLVLIVTLMFVWRIYRKGERISHENQIMRSRFEAAINSSLDAVLVVNTAGKIIEFNGSAEAVFGYPREEAIGADMAELIIPQHMREMHHKGMQRFLETNEQKVIGAGRVQLEAMRKSGEIFPVELSISLAETGGKRVFVSFLRDVTEEVQAKQELQNARDKAQEGEKAKSDLLTVMSHEMRTPLNGILGSLALIDQSDMSERQKRHLNSIAVSGELLLSHVNNVLDLSSLSEDNALPEQTRFDLPDLVQSVADSLHANAVARGNSVQVNVLNTGRRVVQGHKTALQQCLVNLIGNAIKFTSDGTVTIEIEKLSEGDLFEIRIADDGVGIAPENMKRIFEEFVTIDTAFKRENAGTGLGLAITKRLVEAMGGEIDAESVLAEGSLFTMRIPLPGAELPEHLRTNTNEESPEISAKGLQALVVDDNEINRMILTDMLNDLQFTVTEVSNGFDAIEKVANHYFDVILLDISMPGIDGIETLQHIRVSDVTWSSVPAIAVTAHAAKEDHDVILQSDFADILIKPFETHQLRTKLAAILDVSYAVEHQSEQSNAALDFISRFGQEIYSKHLVQLQQDATELFNKVEAKTMPHAEVKEQAHKLSGAAAVLGEEDLYNRLQGIELEKKLGMD